TIIDDGGESATATAQVEVADADPVVAVPDVSVTEGAEYSGTVATFTDPGGLEADASYTATIDWGDGESGPGAVPGGEVHGGHAYEDEGPYSITVTVADDGGSTAEVTVTPGVTDAPIHVTAEEVAAVEGKEFAGTVASLTDDAGLEEDAGYT